MKFDIKALVGAAKQKLGSDRKLVLIVFVGILGMLLVLCSSVSGKTASGGAVSAEQKSAIEEEMSNELTALLKKIDGAGRVEVMLTFESSQESVYAYDTDENIDKENDSTQERKLKSEHIIINSSSGEDGLKVKDIYPQIRGVAVVCDGGNDPLIKGQIISTVSALFNINSTKISVAKMAD